MKNRILSVFLAALMIMSCFGTLAVSAAEYTTPTVAAEVSKQGDSQLRVDVKMYNNPGIAGIKLTIKFDNSHVNVVGYVDDEGEILTDLPNGTLEMNLNDPSIKDFSTLDTVTCSYSRAANTTKNGTLFSVIFDIVGDYEETNFMIIDEQFVNQDQDNVTFSLVHGYHGLPLIEGVTLDGASYVYDGTEKSLAVKGATSDMTVTYEPKSVKNVGDHKIVATVKKAGYATLTLDATLKITPKALTLDGVKVTDKVFDNTTAATVDYSAAALVGVCAGDTVTFTKPTATFADVNVGIGKTMVMDAIKLEGASASNYTLTQPTIKGVIIAKTIEIIPNPDQGHKKGNAEVVITYKDVASDLISGYTITGALSREPGDEIGEYKITMGTLKVEPANGNIVLTLADEVYTIRDKDNQTATVTVPETATYGTTDELKVTVTDHVGVTPAVITYTSSNEEVVKVDENGNIKVVGAGEADITVKIAGNDEFADFTVVKTILIKGKPITVTPASGLTFVYGDEIKLNGFTNNLNIDESQFTGALALDSTDAGTRNVVIGTLALKNHEITLAPETVEITKKALTLTGVELWPTQTPEINPNKNNPTLVGVVPGDDVDVNTPTLTFDVEGDKCTIEGYSLKGADAGNYTLNDVVVAYTYKDDQTTVNEVAEIVEESDKVVISDTGSDMTTEDIIKQINTELLPTGADITGVTANVEGIIDENGNIVRPEEDTTVTFTFTVSINGATSTFTKTVMITAANNTDRLLALMYYYYMMGLNKKDTVSAVKSNIASGEVAKGTAVTLTTETAGATIYYTTDGKTPTTASTVYTAPIVIEGNVTIKAIAVKAGMRNSGVVTFTYKAVDAKTTIALKKDAATIKYLAGYADGTFKPNQAATRYEVIVALNNVFDITTNGTPLAMKDVAADKKAVVDLFTAAGIIDGFPGGEFKGNDGITRAQFAKIAAVMLGLDIKNAKDAGFKDVSGWAAPYINACAAAELVIGTGDGNFEPTKNITRAELATFINRITGAKAGTECSYKDVLADAWYFGQVAAAAK